MPGGAILERNEQNKRKERSLVVTLETNPMEPTVPTRPRQLCLAGYWLWGWREELEVKAWRSFV